LLRLGTAGPERLNTADPVKIDEVLVNLDGYRSTIQLPEGPEVNLVDAGRFYSGAKDDASLRLLTGRMTVKAGAKPGKIQMGVGDSRVEIELKTGHGAVAVQATARAAPGRTTLAPGLLIQAVRGQASVFDGAKRLNLDQAAEVDYISSLGLGTPHAAPLPAWITGTTLAGADLRIAERLSSLDGIPFGAEGVVLTLKQRLWDRARETRRYAANALGAVDEYYPLVEALGTERYADVRQFAAQALRAAVRDDAERLERVKSALLGSFPAEETETMLALLRGYGRDAAEDQALLRRLVELLEAGPVQTRELAVWNLRELTGKDYGFNATDSAPRRATAVRLWKSNLSVR
jgi:hypothetical protein